MKISRLLYQNRIEIARVTPARRQRTCTPQPPDGKRILTLLNRAFVAIISVILLCGARYSALAQTPPEGAPPKTAVEVQAPFDKDGKLWIITEEMERQYGFFPKYRGVIDARLFQLPDSSFVLELTQLLGSTPENTRVRLTLAELIDLRNRVTDALQRGQTQSGNAQGGFTNPWAQFARPLDERSLNDWEKTSLVISATTLGLSYGLLADLLSPSGGNVGLGPFTSIGATTLAAPLVFGGGTLWAVSQPWFTRSSSVMLTNGMTSGFFHGLAGYLVVADQQQIEGRALGISGVIGSAVESGMTLRLPEALNLNYGQTSILANMGGSTFLSGALAALALGALDGNGNISPNGLRLTAAASLLGSAGGYFLGYRIGQGQHIAPGDALVFESPAGFASILPFSVGFLSLQNNGQIPDIRLLSGLTVGAQALGYVLGNELIRNKDFTFDQGRQINQAASLGVTIGLIPLYAGRSNDLVFYAPLLSAVGGAVGFGIAYANCTKQAEDFDKARRESPNTKSSTLNEAPENRTNTWLDNIAKHTDVQFSPLGLMGTLHPVLGLLSANTPIVSIRTNLGAVQHDEAEWQQEVIKREVLSALPR
ncbi:MAG: hypothetical protein ACOVSW_11575 [Candidatus Kapaibacteriota bacterium]